MCENFSEKIRKNAYYRSHPKSDEIRNLNEIKTTFNYIIISIHIFDF